LIVFCESKTELLAKSITASIKKKAFNIFNLFIFIFVGITFSLLI